MTDPTLPTLEQIARWYELQSALADKFSKVLADIREVEAEEQAMAEEAELEPDWCTACNGTGLGVITRYCITCGGKG